MVDDDGEQMELTKCIHCPAYENGIWEEPIDFATDSGFFVLLDAIERQRLNLKIEFYGDTFFYVQLGERDQTAQSEADDLKTALIAATLEFIEREHRS